MCVCVLHITHLKKPWSDLYNILTHRFASLSRQLSYSVKSLRLSVSQLTAFSDSDLWFKLVERCSEFRCSISSAKNDQTKTNKTKQKHLILELLLHYQIYHGIKVINCTKVVLAWDAQKCWLSVCHCAHPTVCVCICVCVCG